MFNHLELRIQNSNNKNWAQSTLWKALISSLDKFLFQELIYSKTPHWEPASMYLTCHPCLLQQRVLNPSPSSIVKYEKKWFFTQHPFVQDAGFEGG